MMGTSRSVACVLALFTWLAPALSWAQPLPLSAATRTIFLDAGMHSFSVPSPVAYHPGFDHYYASDTGSTAVPGFVFPGTGGAPLQTQTPLNIDPRAWNFNANTGQLEIVTFNAVAGGAGQGLIKPGVDSSGMLTGGTSSLLASMPGNTDSQTAPAYDAGKDVFYSRGSTNVVNVVRRSDGSLAGTIVLNFTAAGIAGAYSDGIVFVPDVSWLVVLDSGSNRAIAFDLLGNFVGASTLDITVTAGARRPGYANGQLFVFDGARNGWQGYHIVNVGCTLDADCDDNNPCTNDECNSEFQCEHANNTARCDDGDSCSVNDACNAGTCTGSPAGFEGLACVLHRLKAPGLCADGIPASVQRFIVKRVARAQALADRAEQGGGASFIGKARASIDAIGPKADKAAAAKAASKRISAACAAAIHARLQATDALLGTLP
jgi:hypothetical protein